MTDEIYHIPGRDIDRMEGPRKTHFLNPSARRINKSLSDLAGITGFGFHLIEVEPGHGTTEHHRHHHEDEGVYGLAWQAAAIIGETEVAIVPGDFIGYRKGGAAHSIRNTGTETLRYIIVGERLDHDVADYTGLRKGIFRNRGLPWNLVDHDRFVVPGGDAGKK